MELNNIKKLLREGLLKESISDIVYHFTTAKSAASILRSNQFFLTPQTAGQYDWEGKLNRGKFYYMSTSTSRTALDGYFRGKALAEDEMIRFKLDGRRLNQRYKGFPVDFFSDDKFSDEMEMRVVSDNPRIDSANKYIIEVETFNLSDEYNKFLKSECDRLGVPFYAYNELKYFEVSYKKKVIDVNNQGSEEINVTPQAKKMYDIARAEMAAFILFQNDAVDFDDFIDRVPRINRFDEFVDKTKRNLNRINNEFRKLDDVKTQALALSRTIKSLRSEHDPLSRFLVEEIFKELRRYKSRDLISYLTHKVNLKVSREKDATATQNNSIGTKIMQTCDDIRNDYLSHSEALYDEFFKRGNNLKKLINSGDHRGMGMIDLYNFITNDSDDPQMKNATKALVMSVAKQL